MTIIRHTFPPGNIHQGTTLGNGELGIPGWGTGNSVNISIGVGSLWDHRGGFTWTPQQNFSKLHTALEQNNEDMVRAMFRSNADGHEIMPRSSPIPPGRIVLHLPDTTSREFAGNMSEPDLNEQPV